MEKEEVTKGKKALERQEIPENFKWSIENIYVDEAQWDKDYRKVQELIKEFGAYKDQLNHSEKLLNALNMYEILLEKTLKVYTYAKMKRDEDNRNTKYQGLTDKAQSLYIKMESDTSFFVPEILQISEEKLNQYYNERSELKKYQHYLSEILRHKEHVLSIKEEQILAQVGELAHTSQNIFTMLNNADMKFPTIVDENGEEIEVTHGNYIQLMENSNRKVRKDAFLALYNTYNRFKNTLATTFSSNLKKDYFFASVKKRLDSITLFHTDRGNEFKNKLIDEVLDTFQIKRSLSMKGCPYDNAVAEATFKIFKTEFARNYHFEDLEQLEFMLSDYINWFNNIRIHGTLGYLSPRQYKEHNLIKTV